MLFKRIIREVIERELEWWDQRELHEMPSYVRYHQTSYEKYKKYLELIKK